jgi:mannosyltransferase
LNRAGARKCLDGPLKNDERRGPLERKTVNLIFIAAILFGAAFLRLHELSGKLIGYDEAVSIAAAEKSLSSFLNSQRIVYKPLYFFILNRWLEVVGENAGLLRLLSVIFGVLNVFFLYRLVLILFDKKTAYVSAFLLSISVFHIFHCQQIRQFSLVALLATISVYFLIRYFRTFRWGDLVLLALTNLSHGIQHSSFRRFFRFA